MTDIKKPFPTEVLSPEGRRIITSPWATANQASDDDVSTMSYPDLKGMEVMLLIPNDFYRKKYMGLGPGYIAEALKRCNVDVSITDCSIFAYDDIELAKILIESGVKIFGIGALYPMIKEVERICGIIRAVVPNATIILGGSLPTPIPEFALRKTGADIATIGEAELTMVSLMSVFAGDKSLEEVSGICFIKDGEFFNNGKPTLSKNVTKKEVGWPLRELYPVEKYITAPKFYPFEQDSRVLTISTGRGCPYACNFCFRVTSYRIRPFDDILNEIEYLVERYNVDGFYIADDLLMLSESKIRGFCEGLINRGLNIKYNCCGRVNTVTPEIIKLLKESGCISIYYGLESGNETVLKTMSKKTSLEQIYEAVRLTREAGIYCQYGTMFGQPGESEETLIDTVEMLKKISYGEYRAQMIFGCVPFPGSGLYDWCKQTGRIADDQDFYDKYICQDWSLNQIPINMTELPDKTVEEMFQRANTELAQFFQGKMSQDWVKHFGGEISGFRSAEVSKKTMQHILNRSESSAETFDVSGRS